jgi:hypothetical protein
MAFFASARVPVLSPCIGVCRLLPDGLCEGCHRSGDEIARWLDFSSEQRARLMNEVLPLRAQQRRA